MVVSNARWMQGTGADLMALRSLRVPASKPNGFGSTAFVQIFRSEGDGKQLLERGIDTFLATTG